MAGVRGTLLALIGAMLLGVAAVPAQADGCHTYSYKGTTYTICDPPGSTVAPPDSGPFMGQ